ncbi:hypothetical protein F5884DRAFT_779178 [Xylogone sp. PMI_703]|nr:hypothetical protein F5884DRAFT_779178 [Xylogone sp. PMI_703]
MVSATNILTYRFPIIITSLLTSFIWGDNGFATAQAEYPNPFAPSAGIGTSIQPAGPSSFQNPVALGAGNLTPGSEAAYPNPFAPVAPPNPTDSTSQGTTGCPPSVDNNIAVCPTSHNNVYFTSDGTFFKIQCSHHRKATAIQITTAQSFQECIDKCGQETVCNGINYIPTNSRCTLLSTGASADSEAVTDEHNAYKVDPPTQHAKDENLVVCSTSCPSANGLSYSSIFGETFRITCGKRHGTEYLKIDKQGTLKDCMDSCASYIPCHSVDYHERSRTCYYSNHHGEPTIVTPGFSSAYSLGCSSSCCSNNTSGCRGCSGCNTCSPCVPPKPLGPPMPDLSCGNQGLQYAIYRNTKADGSTNIFTGADYPTFFAEKFKTDPLEFSGKTSSMGFSSSTSIYGNSHFQLPLRRQHLPPLGRPSSLFGIYTSKCKHYTAVRFSWSDTSHVYCNVRGREVLPYEGTMGKRRWTRRIFI